MISEDKPIERLSNWIARIEEETKTKIAELQKVTQSLTQLQKQKEYYLEEKEELEKIQNSIKRSKNIDKALAELPILITREPIDIHSSKYLEEVYVHSEEYKNATSFAYIYPDKK